MQAEACGNEAVIESFQEEHNHGNHINRKSYLHRERCYKHCERWGSHAVSVIRRTYGRLDIWLALAKSHSHRASARC
jgi:hypothetical protein